MQGIIKYAFFATIVVGLSVVQAWSDVTEDGESDGTQLSLDEIEGNVLVCEGRIDGAPCNDEWSNTQSVCLNDLCVTNNREGACYGKIDQEFCEYGHRGGDGTAKRCQFVTDPAMIDGTDKIRVNKTGAYKLIEQQQTLTDVATVQKLECFSGAEVVAMWNKEQCNFDEPAATEGKRCTRKQYVGLTKDGNKDIKLQKANSLTGKLLDDLVFQKENTGVMIIGHMDSVCKPSRSVLFAKGDLGYQGEDAKAELKIEAECVDVVGSGRLEIPCEDKIEGATCTFERIDEIVWECAWQKDKVSATSVKDSGMETFLASYFNDLTLTSPTCDSSGTEKTGWKKCTIQGKCWADPTIDDDWEYDLHPNGTVKQIVIVKDGDDDWYGQGKNFREPKRTTGDKKVYTKHVSGKDTLRCVPDEEQDDEDLICVETNENPDYLDYAYSLTSTLASSAFVVAMCGVLNVVATFV